MPGDSGECRDIVELKNLRIFLTFPDKSVLVDFA